MRAGPRIPYPVYRSTTGEIDRDVFGSRSGAPKLRRRWLAHLRMPRSEASAAIGDPHRTAVEGGLR